MAESNAEKNAEPTSSSPMEPETIKDLDAGVSEEQMNAVKGGKGEQPKESLEFNYGALQMTYTPQK